MGGKGRHGKGGGKRVGMCGGGWGGGGGAGRKISVQQSRLFSL